MFTWFECCSTLSRVAVSGSDLLKIAHIDDVDDDDDDDDDDEDDDDVIVRQAGHDSDSWCRNTDNFLWKQKEFGDDGNDDDDNDDINDNYDDDNDNYHS